METLLAEEPVDVECTTIRRYIKELPRTAADNEVHARRASSPREANQ
jgi:hypothetical protein